MSMKQDYFDWAAGRKPAAAQDVIDQPLPAEHGALSSTIRRGIEQHRRHQFAREFSRTAMTVADRQGIAGTEHGRPR